VQQELDRRQRATPRRLLADRRQAAYFSDHVERRSPSERRRRGQRRGPSGTHVLTLRRNALNGWCEASCSCGASLWADDRLEVSRTFIEWHENHIQHRTLVVDSR
jgi:hypothetical protein